MRHTVACRYDFHHPSIHPRHVQEGLAVSSETQVVAKVTYQNLFRLFPKLSGMTGTAFTEAQELFDIYNLKVRSPSIHTYLHSIRHTSASTPHCDSCPSPSLAPPTLSHSLSLSCVCLCVSVCVSVCLCVCLCAGASYPDRAAGGPPRQQRRGVPHGERQDEGPAAQHPDHLRERQGKQAHAHRCDTSPISISISPSSSLHLHLHLSITAAHFPCPSSSSCACLRNHLRGEVGGAGAGAARPRSPCPTLP